MLIGGGSGLPASGVSSSSGVDDTCLADSAAGQMNFLFFVYLVPKLV